jgi:hypothetical protein
MGIIPLAQRPAMLAGANQLALEKILASRRYETVTLSGFEFESPH